MSGARILRSPYERLMNDVDGLISYPVAQDQLLDAGRRSNLRCFTGGVCYRTVPAADQHSEAIGAVFPQRVVAQSTNNKTPA